MIGQINYLSGKTIPDILFAVHQCAKYNIYPKQFHEEAVKSIGHYLKKKKDKGLFFTPNGSNGLECYDDADFSVSLCREDANQVASVFQKPDTLSN